MQNLIAMHAKNSLRLSCGRHIYSLEYLRCHRTPISARLLTTVVHVVCVVRKCALAPGGS